MALHHMLRAAAGSAPSDPYFENVTLLLTGDGTNGAQNNTFLDSSTNNFTITRNGNTTQGTFSPYGNLWSNYFDGSGDYLSVANNAAFSLASSAFTVEAWVCFNNPAAGQQSIVTTYGSGTSGWSLQLSASATIIWNASGDGADITGTTSIKSGQWYHIAVSGTAGTSTKLFVNGVQEGSTYTGNIVDSSASLVVGQIASSSYINGYISNLRVVKGTALYTSNFTPSTTPLTAVSNTSLLTCQSNRFIDNSSNNFTLTVNGNTSVQRFSPFNPTAPYSAATIGGSGYFDGTGDYLTAAANTAFVFGTGDFTIECWVYSPNWGADSYFISNLSTSSNTSWGIEVYGGNIRFSGWTTNWLSATEPSTNAWHHIAVSRSGTTLSMFVDGVRVATASNSVNYSANNTLVFGDYIPAGGANLNGYLSNARLVKGTAVYDPTVSTCTVPTAPLTAITNTSLLLNFTNAGIPDAAMMNDLETVGNAQVSTSVKKYGTGSLYFDGTGDWLTMPDTVNLQLGTGNFTVECWLYLGATGAARGIVGKGTSTTGWLLSTNTSNQVVFTYGSSTITSATLSGSTWYHIAVCREGTGTNQTKIYVDGTNNGTGTVSTDFNQTNIMYVGADRAGGSAMNGYIDDLRITKGYARYTANFTPPTAALPVY